MSKKKIKFPSDLVDSIEVSKITLGADPVTNMQAATKQYVDAAITDAVPTGAAADKGVDTSISAASTSANLPTSAAVAAFVENKGYKTADNNQTIKGNGTAFGANDVIDILGSGKTTVTATNSGNTKTITISSSWPTAEDLGLSTALKYHGKTSSEISDGSDTNPIVIDGKNHTAKPGCVVITSDDKKEFVWNGSNWELLGPEGSYKVVQTAVTDPAANGEATAFIDTISQDTNGAITVTKKNVQFPASLPANGGNADTVDNKHASDFVAANTAITSATKCKITYDTKGLVTSGADLAVSDIPGLAASKITSGTFADARIASAATWNAKQDAISDLATIRSGAQAGATALQASDIDSELSSTSTNPVQNKVINTALNKKVDTVSGKGLSTNDLTTALKTNYDAAYTHSTSDHAPADAEKNVQSDWNVTDTSSDAFIKNKPTSMTPASHTHGNITNTGELGTASVVVVTDTNKKITTSSIDTTKLGYLRDVTANIQAQITTAATTVTSNGTGSGATYYVTGSTVHTNITETLTKTSYVSFTGNGAFTAYSFNATSDARLKENFEPLTIEKSILDLPTYKFDFKNGLKNQIGCKAQDLQEICPELVTENEDGYLSIQESKIVYLLLDEIKKLRKEVNELKAR